MPAVLSSTAGLGSQRGAMGRGGKVWRLRATRVAPYQFSPGIVNFERQVFRGRLQVVVDHRPIRRVLRGRLFRRKRRAEKNIVVNANSRGRLIQPYVCALGLAGDLPQRRDVVENPESAPVRRDEQVVTMNGDVADGSNRQIQLQRLPVIAIVEGNIDAQLRPGKKQPFLSLRPPEWR